MDKDAIIEHLSIYMKCIDYMDELSRQEGISHKN